jgi:hypothetical protein
MEIEYDLDIEDMVEFNLYALSHHPQTRKRLKTERILTISFAILFMLLGIVMVLIDLTLTPIVLFIAALGFGIYCWFLFNANFFRRRIRKMLIKQYSKIPNDEIGRHKLAISEEGLRESMDFGNSFVNWTAFDSIMQADNYLYFLLNPGKGYIVPKKAFANDTEFNLFADTARKYKASISG